MTDALMSDAEQRGWDRAMADCRRYGPRHTYRIPADLDPEEAAGYRAVLRCMEAPTDD